MNEEIEDFFTFSDTVHDVAIVLKQYLRELEIPVIPPNLHHIFLQWVRFGIITLALGFDLTVGLPL